jgi:hypothetical protein
MIWLVAELPDAEGCLYFGTEIANKNICKWTASVFSILTALQLGEAVGINPLKTERILFNIKTQGGPSSKHSPPPFKEPII